MTSLIGSKRPVKLNPSDPTWRRDLGLRVLCRDLPESLKSFDGAMLHVGLCEGRLSDRVKYIAMREVSIFLCLHDLFFLLWVLVPHFRNLTDMVFVVIVLSINLFFYENSNFCRLACVSSFLPPSLLVISCPNDHVLMVYLDF